MKHPILRTQPTMTTHRLAWPLACTALILGLGACSRIPLISNKPTTKVLEPADFAPAADTQNRPNPDTAIEVATLQPPTQRPDPVLTIRQGAPDLSNTSAAPVETPVLIESKVGDVNGKPIFATEFLEPMGARMAAEAERMPRQEWVIWANRQIERGLTEIMQDELLRAEALSRLTPEQKQGFRAFLQGLRKDLASGAAGSRTLAAKRLAEAEGLTEDEFIAAREQQALVRTTLIRDIDNRVNVSWRDIEQRYQREFDVFNPAPTAAFRLIRVSATDEDTIKQITDALEQGEDFEAVAAESGSNYKPDEGGLEEVSFEGSYAEAELFGGRILNEKAHTLTPGQWTGPFEIGSFVGFLKLEDIHQQSMSLYDAQLIIYQQILAERRSNELKKYMGRLQERASFTELQDMRDRIFLVADRRYGRQDQPRRSP
jgi:hypothetical protein